MQRSVSTILGIGIVRFLIIMGMMGAMIYAIGRPSTSAHGSHGFARGSCGFTRSLCNAIRRHCFLLLNPFRSLPLQHLVLWLSVDIVVVVLRLQFVVVAH